MNRRNFFRTLAGAVAAVAALWAEPSSASGDLWCVPLTAEDINGANFGAVTAPPGPFYLGQHPRIEILRVFIDGKEIPRECWEQHRALLEDGFPSYCRRYNSF